MISRPQPVQVVGTAVAALILVLLAAAPASATSYRYWTYWHGTSAGGWTFSPVGATYRPPAGAVEGWRFAISGAAGTTKPRMAASFSVICEGRTATGTNKLVALVVDYGLTADAPPGESPPYASPRTYCADVASTATAYTILLAYSASTRSAGGLVCGVHGYPATECGVVVTPKPAPVPAPKPTPAASARATHAAATGQSTPSAKASTSSAAPVVSPPASPSSAGTGTSSGSAPPAVPTADAETTFPATAAMGAETEVAGGNGVPLSGLVGGGLISLVSGAALIRSRSNRRRQAK